jgi:hypothetical protein
MKKGSCLPSPGSVHSALNTAIGSLNWPSCKTIIEALPYAKRRKHLHYTIRRLLESGRIVVRRDPADRAESIRRDRFVAQMVVYAGQLKDRVLRRSCEEALATAQIFDEGYREILGMVSRSAAKDLAPGEHAWALLKLAEREIGRIQAALHTRLSQPGEIADLYGLSIQDDRGQMHRPDATIGMMIAVLGSSLQMLAYRSHWFGEDGQLDLPPQCPITEETVEKATATFILGNSWHVLTAMEERWRFFQTKVWLSPIVETAESPHKCRCIESVPGSHLDLLDRVADERLSQLLLRVQTDLTIETMPVEDADGKGGVPLPPEVFLNQSERDFAVTIESILHIPALSYSTDYYGLSFAEWVRGYCSLQALARRLCDEGSGDAPHLVLADSLKGHLVGHGLTGSAAERFLGATTYSRESDDLFDSPLVRVPPNHFCFLPSMVRVLNVSRALLSLLGSKRVQIRPKGKGLEMALRQLFHTRGIRAEGLKFRRDGCQYECDTAVLWDDTLFLFECKNRSLSDLSPSRYHTCGRDPIWWTGCLRCRRPSTNRHLILHWIRVAQHRVASLRIVEAGDVLDDRSPGARLGWPTLAFDQFALQRREEAFGHGVVPAIALAAHAAHNAVAIKLGTIFEAGVLAAAV